MKSRVLQLVLMLTLCLALVAPAASASGSAAVALDAVTAVKAGERVDLKGSSSLDEVIVKVLRPDGSIVYFDIVPVTGGSFAAPFTLGAGEPGGTYTAVAGKGNQVDSKRFDVTASSAGGGNGGGDGTITTPPPATPTSTPTETSTPISTPTLTPTPTPAPGGGFTGGGSAATPAPTTTPAPSAKPITPIGSGAAPIGVDASKSKLSEAVDGAGHPVTVVAPDAAALAEALAKAAKQDNHGAAPVVYIAFDGKAGQTVRFDLPLSALKDAAAGTLVSFQTVEGEYSLPLSVLDLAAIAKQLGASTADITLQITIDPAGNDLNSSIKKSAATIGASQLGGAIGFSMSAAAGGKAVELNEFGSTYVSRTLVVTGIQNGDHATVALYDPQTGTFSFVPALFAKQADGTTKISFKRTGNSIYAVLTADKSFGDLNGHWAKSDVELLASKLVVNGAAAGKFAPNSSITRAEFAALLVRSLGLSPDAAAAAFSDVAASDWHAGVVGAAVKAKLTEGFADGSFKPNDTISRQQMAVMIGRAMTFAQGSAAASASSSLDGFKDKAGIAGWARASVAQAVDAGIITGMTADSFAPAAKASRAQAAVMLKRFLQHAGLIG
ncbi:S-layer homology domain-containing protein [Paenibacillus sp. D51F]